MSDVRDFRNRYCDSSLYNDQQDNAFSSAKNRLGSVAVSTLETYGVPVSGNDGGNLAGIDLKHVDAFSAIRMSLLESASAGSSTNFHLKEVMMDEYGYAKFKSIGDYSGLNSCSFYFTTQSQNFIMHETHVKVTGKKDRPMRNMGSWQNLISESNGGHTWDTSSMATSCYDTNRKRHMTITFNDPHFDATSPIDGIESMFDTSSIWDQVVGWCWYVDPGDVSDSTTIKFIETGANVPIKVGGSVGILKKRTYEEGVGGKNDACFGGLGDTVQCEGSSGTVPITIPSKFRYTTVRGDTVDKLIRVVKVYAVAYKLGLCFGKPKTNEDAFSGVSTEDNTEVWVCIDDIVPTVYQFNEGVDYAFGISEGGDGLCLQFANNSFYTDNARYGDDVEFKVVDACTAYSRNILDGDILTANNDGKYSSGNGTIFPYENLTGLLIKDIWAQVELDTFGLVIEDPEGNADKIAKDMVVEVAPMTMYDEPAPVVIDGIVIDQAEGRMDSDPLTTQNLTETVYERMLTRMDGGNSIEVSVTTLDESQCVNLSANIYNLANEYTGRETTYMCTPNSEPELGGYGNSGGIINNITYSYSDQSNYTITVIEGAHLVGGISGITGGPSVLTTEQVSAKGRVIQDYGNGAIYKVLIDGLGTRDCISSVPSLIRVGDSVSITIYNNPAEIA